MKIFSDAKNTLLTRMCILWLMLWVTTTGQASGWNDFVLDIGDGYQVSKMSSLEVCIGRDQGPLILCTRKGSDIGPVNGYIMTSGLILGRTLGRKSVTYDDGYVLDKIDTDHEFYFIIDKQTDSMKGPFSLTELQARPEVTALGALHWEIPTNPDAALLLGFVFGGLAVFGFVLAAPVILVLLAVTWIRRRLTTPPSQHRIQISRSLSH